MTWVKKYSPKKTSEVIGQYENIKKLYIFASQFPRVRKRAIIVYGGSGVGKTSAAYALANELNWEIVELNASDLRNEQSVISVLGSAAKQASLFGNKKLILVDEIDGMYGLKDRGGVGAVIDVIKESKYPIVITANNVFSS
ncbi:MAG: AAA family ATPase, partial [Nanoarchaeota archaeon]